MEQLYTDVRRAMENHELKAFYQPKFDAFTSKLDAAEALVRWIKPDGTIVSPGEFIPQLERQRHIRTGLVYAARSLFFSEASAGRAYLPCAGCSELFCESSTDGRKAAGCSGRACREKCGQCGCIWRRAEQMAAAAEVKACAERKYLENYGSKSVYILRFRKNIELTIDEVNAIPVFNGSAE